MSNAASELETKIQKLNDAIVEIQFSRPSTWIELSRLFNHKADNFAGFFDVSVITARRWLRKGEIPQRVLLRAREKFASRGVDIYYLAPWPVEEEEFKRRWWRGVADDKIREEAKYLDVLRRDLRRLKEKKEAA